MPAMTLTELFKLADAYNEAFETKLQNDPILERQVNEAVTHEEEGTLAGFYDELEVVERTLAENRLEHLSLRRVLRDRLCDPATLAALQDREDKALASARQEEARLNIKIIELVANVAARAMGKAAMSALVPEDTHSDEISASFAANNAPTLAKIFGPSPAPPAVG